MINVIIPAYNCSTTINKTLSSLVAQTDSNFEVIVVDDCSAEDIKYIIDTYNDKLKIKYIRNKKNFGCGMSRQVGIDNATEKFITFLDADDMFMPYTVEIFNEIVKCNPDTEYVHTYFYEQQNINGEHFMLLRQDGYTWCHGKLYNLDSIKKYDIKNSPLVKYADDSYFNSMCSELLEISICKIPTVLWCNNENSIMRRRDEEREKIKKKDFLNAMLLSTVFVMDKKGHVDHIKKTLENFCENNSLNAEEMKILNKIKCYAKGGCN